MGNIDKDQQTGYNRKSRTITGRLHDELVMMDMEQGKYFSLNPVATRIWDLLEKEMTPEELCSLLTEEYQVDESRCLQEVAEYLEEMVKLGLIISRRT